MTDTNGVNYQLVFEVAHFAFDAALAIYVYIANKNKATNEKIDGIEKSADQRFGNHAERLARLEEGAESLPTHQDVGDVHERINVMTQEVSSMNGEMRAMRHTLQLIQQHLLTGGGR